MMNWLLHLRPLSPMERQVLRAMSQGWTLKSHRYLDGSKQYRLHPLGGEEPLDLADVPVERLVARGLIQTNHKFPAATFLLTERGRAATGAAGEAGPLGPRAFGEGERLGE
jgi:hypothetical protein